MVWFRLEKSLKATPSTPQRLQVYLAAKRTSDLIPLCHPLPLTNVEVDVKVADKGTVTATATVKTKAQTGVEMEALTAVSMALLDRLGHDQTVRKRRCRTISIHSHREHSCSQKI